MYIPSATPASPDNSSLGLLRIPFVFSQDRLLKSEQFIANAKDRGFSLSLANLQELHRHRLLVPLYRVSDDVDPALVIPRQNGDEGYWAHWAASGQLQDPSVGVWTEDWSYLRPDNAPQDWWDGHYYSPWQVLGLEAALGSLGLIDWGADLESAVSDAQQTRQLVLALVALTPRHYSRIWGQASLPAGRTFEQFHDAEYQIDETARLQVAGFPAARLLPSAETLLLRARGRDPLDELWPLLRHGTHLTWEHLKGSARVALEQRVAAEILLRAHEQLAIDGKLDPLPEHKGVMRQPLDDRITVRDGSADSLNRALARFGLSPQPRVLLIVEGDTEEIHFSRLLQEYGLDGSNQVRLHVLETSSTSPTLLANYVTAPRLGKAIGDKQAVDGVLTGLFVAMDPENNYAPSRVADTTRKLRGAVRHAVERQGGVIGEDELDALIHVSVWGAKTYELANFTDRQLLTAIQRLGEERDFAFGGDLSRWREQSEEALASARASESVIDIDHVPGGFGFSLSKPRLAELLLPDLLDALYDANEDLPVLKIMREVSNVHERLSRTGFILRNAADGRANF
jgi:hypothetical protein